MDTQKSHTSKTIIEPLRTIFGRGLVVIVPVVFTIWVLKILFEAVDGIISPLFDRILQQHIPGLGFISMIILIFLVGIFSRNLIGRTLFLAFERMISSIPFARTIYTAMKDLINAFQSGKKGKSFREVVLIEYPRPGIAAIGFVTNEISLQSSFKNTSGDMVTVYIPNPPNPTSGMLVLAPRSEIQSLNMSVEEGLKLVLSGGIVTSGTLSTKQTQELQK